MSVRSIVGGGVRLVRTQPQVVAIWAALYLVLLVVGMIAMRPFMAEMLESQRQAASNAAMGVKTPPAFPAEMFSGILLYNLVLAAFLTIAFAAVVRAIVTPGGDRFAYLRVGMDELRLIGLGVLLMIAAFVAELVIVLLFIVVGGLIGVMIGKTAAAIVLGLCGIALIGGAIYVEVRLSLAGVFTVLRRRITIGEAWRATRGHFWLLFGVYALMTLAFLVFTLVILAITNPHLLSAYAAMNSQAMNGAAQEQFARQASGLTIGMILQLVFTAIFGAAAWAIAFGAVTSAALELGDFGRTGDRYSI